MKNLVFFCFVCAFVSTGFTQSLIKDELDGPDDSRLNSVHSIVFGLAKETLIKLQENLRSAGREKDVQKIGDFISKTDKYLDVSDDEKVDLNDHLDGVYQLIDQYKDYISVENLQQPNPPPITEELIQALIEQLTILIEKFEAKKMYAKAKLLLFYKYLLAKMAAKKAKWALKKEKFDAFILFIIDLIRRFAEEIIGRIPTTTPGTLDDESLENLKITMYRSDPELVKDLLDVIALDLEKIEQGLMNDRRYIEAAKVKLYEAMIKAVSSNTNASNSDRRSVRYALDKGAQLVKQHQAYLKRTNWLGNVISIRKDKIDDNRLN